MDLGIEIAGLVQAGEQQKLEEIMNKHPDLAEGKTPQGISLLTFATYCRNQPAIDLIAARKQNIDLFEAAAIGDIVLLKQHLQNKPELISAYSVDGFTPLGLACFFGHQKIAAYLVELGANVNQPSKNDFAVCPIHSACAISNIELSRLLIENGADVNVKQRSGITALHSALHSAAHHGVLDLVKLLVENGADIKAKDEKKQTPGHMAGEKGFDEVVSYLRSARK